MENQFSPQFQIWALTAAFLFLKMWSNSLIQGVALFKSKHVALPEDARFVGKNATVAGPESDLALRASYCWENDLENIPIFLFLLLGYCFVGGEVEWCTRSALVFCAS